MPATNYTEDEVVQRAQALYEQKIRAAVVWDGQERDVLVLAADRLGETQGLVTATCKRIGWPLAKSQGKSSNSSTKKSTPWSNWKYFSFSAAARKKSGVPLK